MKKEHAVQVKDYFNLKRPCGMNDLLAVNKTRPTMNTLSKLHPVAAMRGYIVLIVFDEEDVCIVSRVQEN
jgi:hypothetical protein